MLPQMIPLDSVAPFSSENGWVGAQQIAFAIGGQLSEYEGNFTKI
jgi:hypothetical protein